MFHWPSSEHTARVLQAERWTKTKNRVFPFPVSQMLYAYSVNFQIMVDAFMVLHRKV